MVTSVKLPIASKMITEGSKGHTNGSICDSNKNVQTSKNKTSLQNPVSNSLSSLKESTNEGTRQSIFLKKLSDFRIPKIARANENTSSADLSQLQKTDTATKINDSNSVSLSSLRVSTIETDLSSRRQQIHEPTPLRRKRKLPINEHQHKRLKSNDGLGSFTKDTKINLVPAVNVQNILTDNAIETTAIVSKNQLHHNEPNDGIKKKGQPLKSNLVVFRADKSIKKKIQWADERNEALVRIFSFRVDPQELADLRAHTRQYMGKMLSMQNTNDHESVSCEESDADTFDSIERPMRPPLSPLPPLIPILLPDTIRLPVVKSQENVLQQGSELDTCDGFSVSPRSITEIDDDLSNGSGFLKRYEPKSIPLDNKISTPFEDAVAIAHDSSMNHISPETVRILEQAKENSLSAISNHTSSRIVNELSHLSTNITSLPNLTLLSISNLLTTLLNFPTLTNQNVTTDVQFNLAPNINLLNLPHHSTNTFLDNSLLLGSMPTMMNGPATSSALNPTTTTMESPTASVTSNLNSQSSKRNVNYEYRRAKRRINKERSYGMNHNYHSMTPYTRKNTNYNTTFYRQ